MSEDMHRENDVPRAEDVAKPEATVDEGGLSLHELDAVSGGARRKAVPCAPTAPAPVM